MAYALNPFAITVLACLLLSGGGTAHEGDPAGSEHGRPYGVDPAYAEAEPPFALTPVLQGDERPLFFAGPRDRWPRQPGGRCCIFTCICINPWLVQFG